MPSPSRSPGAAARDRRRFARPSRLPRPAEIDPRQRAAGRPTRSSASATSCCGSGTPSSPRRSLVAWDTLEVADLPQRGASRIPVGTRVRRRDRRAARLCCRRSSSRSGSRWRRRPGTRPTTSSPPPPRPGRDRSLVTTSDRDAFQLVSDRVTVCSRCAASASSRAIGPAEVRARYGVEPEQVPDFIALRGDPSDRIPGGAGSGRRAAANLLGAVRDARGGARRRPLRADRGRASALPSAIATMDAAAPLPPLERSSPTWRGPRRRHASSG